MSLPLPPSSGRSVQVIAGLLYSLIITLANGLNSGMSAHMLSILSGLGHAMSLAVSISSLRGIGQSSARLAEVLFGSRLHPSDLNFAATIGLLICFAVGLVGGGYATSAAVFAFSYGASNGILSVTRGTLPLVLFAPNIYGAYVGKLLMPSFLFSAASPLLFSLTIEHFGAYGALYLSGSLTLVIVGASFVLKNLTRRANLWFG